VSSQSQIVNLLLDLQRRLGLTVLFITHDLSVVRQVADRVMVMYLGRVMEITPADTFFAHPVHPYSEALLAAAPRFHAPMDRPPLVGEIPSPIHPPDGCPFVTRCPIATDHCALDVPPLHAMAPGHLVACIKR
jgi:oligopeptide/dipeptide ABC transporter ATP-binding protein